MSSVSGELTLIQGETVSNSIGSRKFLYEEIHSEEDKEGGSWDTVLG